MFYAPHKSLLTVLVDRYVSIGEGKSSALLATFLEEIPFPHVEHFQVPAQAGAGPGQYPATVRVGGEAQGRDIGAGPGTSGQATRTPSPT